jgi:heterodisulfide reductase subunit A-like polyferredoxin
MKKKLFIVDGGVTGITAGIYACMNGFETTIIEKHAIFGENCTSWKNKDYR